MAQLCSAIYSHAISVANPLRVRRFAQGLSMLNKTDEIDSDALARYGAMAELRLWHPEPENIRFLRELMRRRDAVIADRTREKNRLEKTECTHTSSRIQQMIKDSIAAFDDDIKQIDQLISELVNADEALNCDLNLLKTIPAISDRTGLLMLHLFRSHQFDKASQAAAYVGLVPLQRRSGSSVRGVTSLSKAGSSRFRAGLYMAAVVAIRHNPHIKAMYDRLRQSGKSTMSALCAAMRKLVHICYGVLKHQKAYEAGYLMTKSA